MKNAGVLFIGAALAVVAVAVFWSLLKPADSLPQRTASSNQTHGPPPKPVTPVADVHTNAAPAEEFVPHRGLPATLAEFPRPEIERAVQTLKEARAAPPEDIEAMLDYKLKLNNRLETCLGDRMPASGKVVYNILFQPPMSGGKVAYMGSANRVTIVETDGLNADQVNLLANCGGKALYGLPLEKKRLPPNPEYHVYMKVDFPITAETFPYKLLRTGTN